MAKLWTTEQEIAEVRRIGAFNDVESEGKTDADIINALDLVMLDELVPSINMLQEEYLVRNLDVNTVADQEFVDLPARAVGNMLRDIWISATDGSAARHLPQLNRENRPFYGNTTYDYPSGFYMQGDHVVLVPKIAGAKTLHMSYMFRPGQLVKSDAYRTVSSIDSTTGITVDSTVPTAWTTANTFDVHSPKSGAENRVFGYAASTVSGTTITFTTAIDGTVSNTFAVEVGDYVCLAETAAIPSLPRELHPVLAQAATCRLLESDGDAVALQIARQTLARQIQAFTRMMDSRVEGKPHKTPNRNSFLSRQYGGRW